MVVLRYCILAGLLSDTPVSPDAVSRKAVADVGEQVELGSTPSRDCDGQARQSGSSERRGREGLVTSSSYPAPGRPN